MSMIKCIVKWYGPCLMVTFPDHPGKSMLIQSDIDQASFAYSCGLIHDEHPLHEPWIMCDPTDITECLEDYLDVANTDPVEPTEESASYRDELDMWGE